MTHVVEVLTFLATDIYMIEKTEEGEHRKLPHLCLLSRINPQAAIGFFAKTVGLQTVVFN